MTEQEFKERFTEEKPIYEAWGHYVSNEIVSKIRQRVENVDYFLKVPPNPRVKETNSLIEKAFYRGKPYVDPYNEITDKVGVRFVVLLLEDIGKIADIIEDGEWKWSKDKDFDKERFDNPDVFTYQSDHYIIYNKNDVQFNGMTIPEDVPCEIQIRTLLQHAYSELTHDTIYKPKTQAIPLMKRYVARSMALIETADDLFREVNKMFSVNSVERLLPNLIELYSRFIAPEFEKKLNIFILDAFKDLTIQVKNEEIEAFISKNDFLTENIALRYDENLLYRQPVILLIYYLISKKPSQVVKHWPLTQSVLHPLYSDLGRSFPI